MRDESERFPDAVIKSIYHQFIMPDESEGWDEFYVRTEDGHSVRVEWQKPLKTGRRGKPVPHNHMKRGITSC